MLRYGRDYGRWNGQGRYDWERPGGYGHGLGGPRNDDWGVPRHPFSGEGGWMGGESGGQFQGGGGGQFQQPGYDYDYGGGFGSGYSGYGNDYVSGRGGGGGGGSYGGGMGYWGRSNTGQFGGREGGYGSNYGPGSGSGFGGYESGTSDFGGGRRDTGNMGNTGNTGNANMRAADIMTDNPEAVSPDTTLAEVAQKMRDLDVGIIPVVDDPQTRRLRGVVTDRDITIRATAEGKDARSTRVSEVMTSQVESVNKNDPIRSVLSLMQREQVKRVPVTDREGRLVGIIAEADLLTEYEGRESDRVVEQTLERVYEPNRSGRGGSSRGRGQNDAWGQSDTRGQTEMRAGGNAGNTGNAGNMGAAGTTGMSGASAAGRGQRKGTETQE